MPMIEPTDVPDGARQQLLMMAWFSPAFPVGGFAFSHALEWAQECGAVTCCADLEIWIEDIVRLGSGRADAILLAAAWRVSLAGDMTRLQAIIDLGAALQPSGERYLEATVQGQAFLTMVRAAYPFDLPVLPADLSRLTLPVAAGLCGAAHGVALCGLLTAYLGGFVANLCSAAVRLGIVGAAVGQRVLAGSHPAIAALSAVAATATLDDLGSAALRSDLFSLQHETQYSRLFRS